jgi:hypothetical protein
MTSVADVLAPEQVYLESDNTETTPATNNLRRLLSGMQEATIQNYSGD